MGRVERERAAAQREGQLEDRPPHTETTDLTSPGNARGAPDWRAPKVAAPVRVVNQWLRFPLPEPDVGADAEHSMCLPVGELFRVVGKVNPDRAEAEVAPDHPPEVGLVVRSARRHACIVVIPDPGRDVRLDAHDRRGQWHAQPNRAEQHGLHRSGHGAGSDLQAVTAAELQVDGDRDEAAADQAERGRAAEGGYPLADEVGLPGRHPAGQRARAGPEHDPAPDGVASPRDRKSTRLNSSHSQISYAVFCLKKKKKQCDTRVTPNQHIYVASHLEILRLLLSWRRQP